MDYPTQKADGIQENASIESYLNTLCAPLHNLPKDAQDEIRLEIGAHLQSLMAMKREPNRVLESALQQFGDPAEIGRLLALEWENREWDLSGLTWLERIQKIREAAIGDQENWHKAANEKRKFWLMPLMMAPSLLLLTKMTLPPKNPDLIRVLDVATLFFCALALVVFWTWAWRDWHSAARQGQDKVSRASQIRLAVSQVFIGLYPSMPLVFAYSSKLSPKMMTGISLIIIAVSLGFCALMFVLASREPSRKTKLASTASMGWGGICGLLLIPGGFRLLAALGITSIWVQLLILCPALFILGRWFQKGKASAKDRKKVE